MKNFKKSGIAVIIFSLLCAITLTGCPTDSDDSSSSPTTMKFEGTGTSTGKNFSINEKFGFKVTFTSSPKILGIQFSSGETVSGKLQPTDVTKNWDDSFTANAKSMTSSNKNIGLKTNLAAASAFLVADITYDSDGFDNITTITVTIPIPSELAMLDGFYSSLGEAGQADLVTVLLYITLGQFSLETSDEDIDGSLILTTGEKAILKSLKTVTGGDETVLQGLSVLVIYKSAQDFMGGSYIRLP